MMRRRKSYWHGAGHRAAGYTLLELLVVLAIAGFIMASIADYGAQSLPGAHLKSAAQQLVNDLRSAQTSAIANGIPVTLALQAEHGSYTIEPGEAVTALPPGTTISFVPFAFLRGKLVGIRFFPDGSATGGEIDLGSSARTYHIVVDWLTGRVSFDG